MQRDCMDIGRVYSVLGMPSNVIRLPGQFNGLTMSHVVRKLGALASSGALPKTIAFDFGTLRFIRPAGVTFLNNLVEWLHVKRVSVEFSGLSPFSAAISYLDDSLFFERHLGDKLNEHSRPRNTTLPLKVVSQEESHMWLRANFTPWLAARLELPEASLYPFQTCVSELFNNIQDHSHYDIGCIFLQHFPHESRVIICVSDFGRGIPDSVRQVRPRLSDAHAIIKAVEEGFTTKSVPRNQGAGLEYLLRTVALANGGSLTIYSGNAIVRFGGASGSVEPEVIASSGFSPGTIVEVELRTDTIVRELDAIEEFACLDRYAAAAPVHSPERPPVMVTRVIDIVAACDTSDQGDLIFQAIAPALRRGEVVELSFAGVSTVTSSFVNAAFVELLRCLNFAELKAGLRITSSTKQINDMIRHRLTREASRMQPAA